MSTHPELNLQAIAVALQQEDARSVHRSNKVQHPSAFSVNGLESIRCDDGDQLPLPYAHVSPQTSQLQRLQNDLTKSSNLSQTASSPLLSQYAPNCSRNRSSPGSPPSMLQHALSKSPRKPALPLWARSPDASNKAGSPRSPRRSPRLHPTPCHERLAFARAKPSDASPPAETLWAFLDRQAKYTPQDITSPAVEPARAKPQYSIQGCKTPPAVVRRKVVCKGNNAYYPCSPTKLRRR